MKRTLKFRVWNGTEMEYNVTVGKFGVFYVNPGNKDSGLDENDSASLTPFNTKYSDTIPVMQYTGLKDKNGKEIYEGDLIKSINITMYGGIRAIEWDPLICAWVGKQPLVKPILLYDFLNPEVVGNIYQNPELLKP